jgi:hypothetical protein
MPDFQAEKRVVLDALAALDAASPDQAAAALAAHTAPDWAWRGMHPFNELTGADAVAEAFWAPLKRAMGPLQRRPDMFLAGENTVDGRRTRWVVQMGHLMGLWDQPFLGIPPTRKIAFLRFCEFHRIDQGCIAETACFLDLLGLVQQTGLRPLPPQTGAAILTPGPRTQDGLLYGPQDPQEGRKTIDLIAAMIQDLIDEGVHSPADHMARFWTPDMCWFGPAGIGASAFFKGYRRGHTQPFEDGLEFIKHYGHICRVGEGSFGGFFGWPSMQMRCTGGFMGLPATEGTADMRIIDMYRREGDLLAENWIFIDIPHFLAMQGLDVLGRLMDVPHT